MNKILQIVIVICIVVTTCVIGYYFLIFIPQAEHTRALEQEQKRLDSIKESCINTIKGQEDAIHKLTDYSPFVEDRGCFLEAGCMSGVTDSVYKAKFDNCNNDYYNSCLANVKKKSKEKFEAEKQKRIDGCIKQY